MNLIPEIRDSECLVGFIVFTGFSINISEKKNESFGDVEKKV
jgi:hypothetical protein